MTTSTVTTTTQTAKPIASIHVPESSGLAVVWILSVVIIAICVTKRLT